MGTYVKLSEGVILRSRPNCEYSSGSEYVAVDNNGVSYFLNKDVYDTFSKCDGSVKEEEVDRLGDFLNLYPKMSDLLTFRAQPSWIHPKQNIVTDGLVTPCRQVIWHLTRNCNMSCDHCYYLYDKQKMSFSPTEIEKIASNISILGAEAVRVSGGEPSVVEEDFRHATELLTKSYCLPVIVNTNGWKNQDTIMDAFVGNAYMRAVQISLDGPKMAHNNMRKCDSFDQVTENIRRYRSRNIHVRIVSMLTSDWLDTEHVMEMCSIVSELGVTDWVVEVPSVTGRWDEGVANERQHILLAAIEFHKFLSEKPHSIKSFSLNQVFDWPRRDSAKKTLDHTVCAHHLGLLSFGPEGACFCSMFREQFVNVLSDLGSMDSENIEVPWNRIARLRISHAIGGNPACRSCDIFPVCQGGCPGQYSDASNFSGCDNHSRNLALVKKSLFADRGWLL